MSDFKPGEICEQEDLTFLNTAKAHPENLRFRFDIYPVWKHTAGCELSALKITN
jgi:hypothetical protein